ncbi:hypothetical protein Q2V58_28905, partial [Escherichia coli]|nr:hypothetical protein [Escherichia coli]
MLPSETMIWQPEFTDKTLSRKPGAVQTVWSVSSGSTKIMSIIFNGHYRMKHRTWITEALRLHFEEHLP